jgi:FAD/FMN-containing dehydrogenase
VTADGEIERAGPARNEDLFWAIRGGGGNFGVVTRFRYRLHDVGTVYGGALALPPQPRIIRDALRIAAEAPDELTIIADLMPLPPLPVVPTEHHGKLALVMLIVYAGDLDQGRKVVAPFEALATPYGAVLGPLRYPAIYGFTEEAGQPGSTVVRSSFLRSIDDSAIDGLLDHLAHAPVPMTMVQLRVLGGHMSRVDRASTAFAHRDAGYLVLSVTTSEDPGDVMRRTAWAESLQAVFGSSASGAYVNFLEDDAEARVTDAYPTETMNRLRAVKRRYDPNNLFRSNVNVQP